MHLPLCSSFPFLFFLLSCHKKRVPDTSRLSIPSLPLSLSLFHLLQSAYPPLLSPSLALFFSFFHPFSSFSFIRFFFFHSFMRDPQDTPLPSSFWTLSRILSLSRTALLVLASAWLVQLTFSPKAAYLVSNVRNLHHPIQYHGADITTDFFEGWYFKMVKTGKTMDDPIQSMAIIPGIHRPSPDNSDQEHAFVIVVGIPGPESAAYFRFPISDFTDLRGNTQGDSNKGAFKVQIGSSFFSHDEIILNLPANRFDRVPAHELEEFYTEASRQYEVQHRKTNSTTLSDSQDYFRQLFPSADTLTKAETQGPLAVHGHFQFPASSHTPLPTSRWTPSIMGITAYLPFLECNHGVASLHHTISKGRLVALRGDNEVLGEAKFDGGVGYIEKDWGVNFPSTWVWAQANMFDTAPGSSLMVRIHTVERINDECCILMMLVVACFIMNARAAAAALPSLYL